MSDFKSQFTDKGTISDFLKAQGATPFLRAADEESDRADDLADMDSAIGDYCALSRTAEPTEIEERKQLHLEILHRQLEAFRKEKAHDT